MTHQTDSPEIELCVRSLAPAGTPEAQISVINRLETLTDAGAIDRYTVRVMGRGVVHENCCLRTSAGTALLQRLAAVDSWTSDNGATVPGIETVTINPSPVHDRPYTMTILPECLLLEYEGDRLSYVAPASVGDDHCSVEHYLDAMAQSGDRRLPGRAGGVSVPAPFRTGEDRSVDSETPVESKLDVAGDLTNAF